MSKNIVWLMKFFLAIVFINKLLGPSIYDQPKISELTLPEFLSDIIVRDMSELDQFSVFLVSNYEKIEFNKEALCFEGQEIKKILISKNSKNSSNENIDNRIRKFITRHHWIYNIEVTPKTCIYTVDYQYSKPSNSTIETKVFMNYNPVKLINNKYEKNHKFFGKHILQIRIRDYKII